MSERDSSTKAVVAFEGINPIFRVRDLATSLDYYLRVLQFKLDWEDPGIIASVSRDRCGIFLCEGDQGNPGSWVWVGVEDVDRLFDEYIRLGAKIRHPPTNYPWACEMQVEDLDGNVLRLGSESKAGEPFGPWFDMKGDLWIMDPAGRWARAKRD